MNTLIERYVYDVTRRLPEAERGEVARELEAIIADMTPDSPGEQDVADALAKLGAPRAMAEQYRQKPRFLISPAMYELYISVLKTVTAITAGVCACIGVFTSVTSGSLVEIISSAAVSAAEGALQAAFWITLGFALNERGGASAKPWTVDDLPRLPEQNGVSIKRSSSVAGIIMSVFFTGLLVTMIKLDAPFLIQARNAEVVNIFSGAALERGVPYLFILGGLALAINALKLYWARWNVPLCIANIIHNAAWVSVVVYILRWPDLINGGFIAFINARIPDAASVPPNMVTLALSALFILAAAVDILVSVWNTWKGLRK